MTSRDNPLHPFQMRLQPVLPEIVALPTVKCTGAPTFVSQAAQDVACILELNPDVVEWSTRPPRFDLPTGDHVADICMLDVDGVSWLLYSPDRISRLDTTLVDHVARQAGYRYRLVKHDEIYSGYRLRNARDLLRYANYTPSLADRLPLLAALDAEGSLTMAEAICAVIGRNPVAAVASLILRRLLDVELDDALIGPETTVRRIRG